MKSLIWIGLLLNMMSAVGQNQARIDTLMQRLQVAAADSAVAKLQLDLGYEWSDIDPEKARIYLKQAEKFYKATNNKKRLCDVFFNMGIVYEYEHKRDSSLICFNDGIVLGKKINDETFLGRAYVGLGWSHVNNNAFPQAIDAFYKAIALAEKNNNFVAWGDALAKVGNLYIQMGQIDEGLSSYRRSLEKYSSVNDSANMAKVLGSLGFAYRTAQRYDSAIYYLDTAIAAFKHLNYLTMIPVGYTEKGMAYLQSNRPKQAIQSFIQALDYHKITPYLQHQDALHINMGKAYLELKELPAAKLHIDTGLSIAISTNDLEFQRDGYEALSLYYETVKNFELAFKNKLLHEAVKDSLDSREQKNVLRKLTTQYDFEKQQREIEKGQFKLKQRNGLLAGSAVVFLFLILLGISYNRRTVLKKEKQMAEQVLKQQDLATKAVMEAEENERRRIATELHDGVGQTMSAARMNLSAFEADFSAADPQSKIRFEKIVSLVDESCKEVRSVSHSMMPNALLKRGLASAVAEFVEKLDQRIIKVQLHTEGLDNGLDANTETMLYRIVQECVNNVIKHSGANRLDIAICHDKDGISLTIEDNGRGFNLTAGNTNDGFGLKNLKNRVAFLKGTIEWQTASGQGTLVAIYVPPHA